MKWYNKVDTLKFPLILASVFALLILLITFQFVWPQKPSDAELKNYTVLAECLFNNESSSEEINYSLLAAEQDDIKLKIDVNKDGICSASIETFKVIINFTFSDGEILDISYTYWPIYLVATLICIALYIFSFFMSFLIIGTYIFYLRNEKT